MKKFLSILLLLAMLSAVLVSCGGDTGDGKETTPAAQETTTPAADESGADTSSEVETYDIPVKDLEGYAFTKLNHAMSSGIGFNEELFDENSIMDQAVRKRDSEISDKYNIVYDNIFLETNSINGEVLKTAMQSEATWDYGTIHGNEHVSNVVSQNAAYDIKEMPYMDLSRPWYLPQANEEFTIMGKQYMVTAMYPGLSGGSRFLFNKSLVKELNLEEPYEIILNGEWTIELLLEYTSAGYVDVDDVAGPSGGDRFGYSGHSYSVSYFYQGMGGRSTTKDENGALVPLLSNDTINARYAKIQEFYKNQAHWINDSLNASDPASSHRPFYDGNSMFCYWITSTLDYTEIENFEYGLAILPKYDLDQEQYHCPTGGGSLALFPCNLRDADATGLIFEALCEASMRLTYPATIQEAVDFEELTDEGSIEVQKLQDKSLTYDVLCCCDPSNGQLGNSGFINYCLKNNTTPAIAAPSAQAGLEALFTKFFYGE